TRAQVSFPRWRRPFSPEVVDERSDQRARANRAAPLDVLVVGLDHSAGVSGTASAVTYRRCSKGKRRHAHRLRPAPGTTRRTLHAGRPRALKTSWRLASTQWYVTVPIWYGPVGRGKENTGNGGRQRGGDGELARRWSDRGPWRQQLGEPRLVEV